MEKSELAQPDGSAMENLGLGGLLEALSEPVQHASVFNRAPHHAQSSLRLTKLLEHDVKIGKSQIESVITRRSAEQLRLKKADKVMAVIKSTEVMLQE